MTRYQQDRLLHPDEYFRAFNLILKACPFCRSGNVALYLGPMPHITCVTCHADGPTQEKNTDEHKHRAGVAWNAGRT